MHHKSNSPLAKNVELYVLLALNRDLSVCPGPRPRQCRPLAHQRERGRGLARPPPPPTLLLAAPVREMILRSTHTGAHRSVLESANPRMDSECASGCTWSTARAAAPSPGRPTPGVVKQDKSSGGSIDTTKTRSGPQRVGVCKGERPIGAAAGKQSDAEALCQPPPYPTLLHKDK